MNDTARKLGFGTAFMLGGSVLIIGTLLMINRLAEGPEATMAEKQSTFKVERQTKPPQRVERQEPQRQKRRRNVDAPMVDLDTNLSGVDMGLPGFETSDLNNLQDKLLGDTRDVVMTDDSVDSPPRPTHQEPVEYPPRARNKGVEGYVVLSLLISASGEIEKIQVLESQPSGLFEEQAIQGVKQWRFAPAQYQGRNVRVWAKQRIRFDLS